MANQIDLTGRIAAVTGGAQGIGRAIAGRLAVSGARVAIWDQDLALAESAAAELGGVAVACDVADFGSVVEAERQTVAAFGGLDILVNNAGIAGANAPLADYPIEEWRRVLAIDLDGVFHGCRRWCLA